MPTSRSTSPEWQEPLAFARPYAGLPCVLLYSGMRSGYSGRFSLFAHSPARIASGDHFAALDSLLGHSDDAYANAWFGYLGYELLHDLETVGITAPAFIPLPRLWMAQFEHLYVFDHDARTLKH